MNLFNNLLDAKLLSSLFIVYCECQEQRVQQSLQKRKESHLG